MPLVALLVTAQLVGPVLGSKLVRVGPLVLDGALVLFPISYICGDAITEVYGYRLASRVIWITFGCQLLVVMATALVQVLPPAPGWHDQAAYARILGMVPRLVVAGLVANLAGEFVNAMVVSWLKRGDGRGAGAMARRFLASTASAQAINSLLFYSIGFAGTVPASTVLAGIWGSWLFKLGYEALALPISVPWVQQIKRRSGLDV
ncbi:MAG: queuosine precursor transporter, partial [Vulcanococcus sp.]